ncbi:MAG: S8 family serine peptidase [Micromonosporaceae bacterium]|nr:S8 family serine peptidase [Micromonosporaceae bacterium]
MSPSGRAAGADNPAPGTQTAGKVDHRARGDTPMVRPARWLPTLLAATLTATLAAAAPAAAASSDQASPAASGAGPARVTLITGDVVELAEAAPGRYAGQVEPAPGRERISFHTLQADGQTLVVPSDALPYLAAGILDDRLFDVPTLVADGYAARETLPLIVRYEDRPAAGALTAAAQPLASIGGAALAPERDQLAELWTQLAGGPVAAAAGAEPALAGGVAEIWLDAPVTATLDRSVGQVGAPDAWAAGSDGTGTTVAVLDTGIDGTHPDLAGKVRAAANFSTSPTTEDRFGHGTHVAGIVASTGAASGGARAGVAPGAELLNGKVLNDSGQGFTSDIIEGMEWAASQGADVVNMSLGGGATDGTDPLSQAVDRITAESGTLFVISAGNSGGEYSVGSPGAATAALTVGAVDRDESLAPFSSRGPRLSDDAIKPEITAPGVGIVSARAAGVDLGRPVDEHYLSASGTSMSAPHVAGAAALLAQAHPEWDGPAVKDALVSTAAPNPELSLYEQGAGRLDAARAVTGSVHATGVVNFGYHAAGQGPTPVVDGLTYTNRTADPVTLELAVEFTNLEGGADASAAVSLDAATVTVPAGTTASVPVRLDLAALDRGRHGGVVTATGPDGTVARTVLGATLAGATYPVTLRGEHADGSAAHAVVYVLYGETKRGDRRGFLLPGPRTELLEEGTYQLTAVFNDHNPQFEQTTLVVEPELEVTGPAEVVLRPDTAVPVRVETPKPAEQRTVLSFATYRELPNGRAVAHGVREFSNVQQVNVTPTAPVAAGELEFYSRWQLQAPMVDAMVPGGPGEVSLRLTNTSPDPGPEPQRLPLVYAGTGSPKELAAAGVAGAAALVRPDPNLVWDADVIAAAAEAGATAVVLARPEHWTPWTSWSPAGPRDALPALVAGYQEGQEMIEHARSRSAGQATIRFTVTTSSPYLYDVLHVERDRIPDQVVHRVTGGNSARVPVRYTDTGNDLGWAKEQRFGWRPWMTLDMSNDHQRIVRAGTTRDEWVSTGDSLWQHRVAHYFPPESFLPLQAGAVGPVQSYPDNGRPAPEIWFAPVVRPAVPAGWPEPSIREVDRLALRIPEFVDPDGHYGFAEADFFSGIQDRVQARLWRDGTLVEELPDARRDVFVDPEPATYRLELTTERDHAWQWATRTDTAWEFESGRPDGPDPAVLPLLQVDYDVPADRTGRVDGARPHLLGLALRHQDGLPAPRAAHATVEVSFDDGASWRQVPVFGIGRGELSAVVPAGDEAVSLRVHATDTHGNAVTQTVLRAYGLR